MRNTRTGSNQMNARNNGIFYNRMPQFHSKQTEQYLSGCGWDTRTDFLNYKKDRHRYEIVCFVTQIPDQRRSSGWLVLIQGIMGTGCAPACSVPQLKKAALFFAGRAAPYKSVQQDSSLCASTTSLSYCPALHCLCLNHVWISYIQARYSKFFDGSRA